MGKWPLKESGIDKPIGATQLQLLRSARDDGMVMLGSVRHDNARWCAAKRLTQRGLLKRDRFGSQAIGWVTVYKITEYGAGKLAREERSQGAGSRA